MVEAEQESVLQQALAGGRVFLTGGNGFVGSHVARALVEAGSQVVALVRPGSSLGPLTDLQVEIVRGDLTQPAEWAASLAGCAFCFHVAAHYGGNDQADALYAVNVAGTSALLAACAAAGVRRVIHTSTIGTVGRPADPTALPDETIAFHLWDSASHYVKSKYLGELIARRWNELGPEVVIVKPTAPVGAGDGRPTATGRRILASLAGQALPYPPGGINHVPVRDVATGHLLAAVRGAAGATYILGHRDGNLDQAAFLRLVGQAAGRSPLAPTTGAAAGQLPTALTANPTRAIREFGPAPVGPGRGLRRGGRLVPGTGRGGAMNRLRERWLVFWMAQAGLSHWGRIATRLATWAAPPYKGKRPLARLHPAGYISPRALMACRDLRLGAHCYVDDDVVIYDRGDGGHVTLGDGVHLYRGVIIELGQAGCVEIGAGSHIQPRCQFTAFVGSVRIGAGVQVAPACAFYPYQHSFAADRPIAGQPLRSKGDIVIGDGAWLGYGAIVLDGVTIGRAQWWPRARW